MSSELVQARFPLRRVALFGGGRWSRVLLPVIQSLLVEDAEILWVTKHGLERAEQWLRDNGLNDKAVSRVAVHTEIDLSSAAVDSAVVATSPATHGAQVSKLLKHRIPTLCEKPFTLDLEEAAELERIALDAECPLGVNLEMYFASFIEDFAAKVIGRDIRTIEVNWLDPWSESRYGELKHGDVYTSSVDDMWPHCWSLFRRLFPNCTVDSVEEVRYDPSSGLIQIAVRVNDVAVTVSLSRRADRRVRKIDVNHGEAVLDFSMEPGSTEIDGVLSANAWRGARPLSRSLSSFFEVVLNPELTAAWALAGCLDAVRSARLIGDKLSSIQQDGIRSLRKTGVELANAAHRNLIVDSLLPEYAAGDRRWPAITQEEQIEFIKHVCATQGIRCR